MQGTGINYDNLIKVPLVESTQRSSSEFSPSLMLANLISIVHKIDELNLFVMSNQTDFVFVTEAWLNDFVSRSYLHIPGYHFINKNRSSGIHGVVGHTELFARP